MRRALLFIGLVCGFTSADALTFQFVSKSTRKIVVPTTYNAVTPTTINQLYVVGRAGDDMMLQRIDRFGNVFAQAIYDGPDLGAEDVLDVVVDNFNRPVVLYRTPFGTRLAKFEATLGNTYDIPVGSSDQPTQLHAGLAGSVIAVGEDSNTDMLAKKFNTNGGVVWRTVILESGFTDFEDGAVGPGEEVAIAGRNAQRGIVARLRGSDGARTATFISGGNENPANRVETIAYARGTSFLYGAGALSNGGTVSRTAIRITTTTNALVQTVLTGSTSSNFDIAASSGATPDVALVGDGGSGMEMAILNPTSLVPTFVTETHPGSPKVVAPDSGGLFVYGDSGTQLAIPNSFVRFDDEGDRTYSIASFTDQDRLIDASEFFNLGVVAVGSSRDANNQRVGLLMAGGSFGPLLRYTEQRVHHPRRTWVDSVTDAAGAHISLTDMDGAIEAPFVVKNSATGQQIWGAQLSFPGLPFLRPIAMAIGPNGHPVIACTGKATEDPDAGNWVLFQLNGANGSVRWSKILSIGNPATGRPRDIDIHSDNSIGVVGNVNFFGIDSNFAAARLTTAGVVQWTRIFQTQGPDRLEACRFRPTGQLATIGIVGGSFPGRLQLITFGVDGGFNHQSVIDEDPATPSGIGMDMEPSGNMLVFYKMDVLPGTDPDATKVRRIDPMTGTTLMQSTRTGAPNSRAAARVSPDGAIWVVHTGISGLVESYRVNASTGVQSQALNFAANVLDFGDIAIRADNTAIISVIENATPRTTAVARRLPTGGQAALRRIAGIGRGVRNGPGGVVWVAGDVAVRDRGTEQFAAKYSVP